MSQLEVKIKQMGIILTSQHSKKPLVKDKCLSSEESVGVLIYWFMLRTKTLLIISECDFCK